MDELNGLVDVTKYGWLDGLNDWHRDLLINGLIGRGQMCSVIDSHEQNVGLCNHEYLAVRPVVRPFSKHCNVASLWDTVNAVNINLRTMVLLNLIHSY